MERKIVCYRKGHVTVEVYPIDFHPVKDVSKDERRYPISY